MDRKRQQGEDMDKKKQMHAPVYEALEKLKKRRVVPFDVPGHREGGGIRSWWNFWVKNVSVWM